MIQKERCLFSLLMTVCLVVMACGNSTESAVKVGPVGSDADVLADVRSGWLSAYSAGDAERLVAYFAVDAELLNPGEPPVIGKDSIFATLQGWFKGPARTINILDMEVRSTGNLAVERASYSVLDSTATAVGHGKYVMVWQKYEDDWKIVYDMWSRNQQAH